MRIHKILVPTDFSDCSKAALEQALTLAAQYEAELCLLHVVALHGEDPNHPDSHFPEMEAIFKSLETRASESMDELVSKLDFGSVSVDHEWIRAIAPGPAIVEYAAQKEIDLTVLGTHGRRGIRRWLLGSVTEEVIRTIDCPVLTVGCGDSLPKSFERILVPYDFSDDSDAALEAAIELAKQHGGSIDLVHVVAPPSTAAAISGIPVPASASIDLAKDLGGLLAQKSRETAKKTGADLNAKVLEGYPEMQLVEYAERHDADLIVMGSHGSTGLWRFLLGSVTEKVVRTADCPVWVVRRSMGEGDEPEA